ncbi:ECF transporter S component [Butyrivibrio hungatei]|uniref:ECF transporter S component n=1 Tax=Butyrivibrio hungatei TaxID=185008 RepID=A0A1D9NYB9_9FIRM|nr:ECF transporter S component [Butyrivibrio hungatei]AOZ95299.1 hypothetical protein bhn_I0264 [Butyrivibrio hungatei]
MKQQNLVKNMVTTAMCIALCVVLPMAFHMIPNAGSVISPMHIPVLICGLVCGWQYGLVCGLVGPLLSSMLTGMPPMAILPAMMVELAVYGICTGIMIKLVNTGKIYADLYISLVVAMLAGRVIGGLSRALIFARGEYSIKVWATSYFVTSLPGIIIQLIFIPTIVFALYKAGLATNSTVKKAA